MHVCVQKNERLTHLFMRIFLLALFPDLHFVVIFCSSEFMCRDLFFIWALYFFIPPPPNTFVTHDETNQAMNKLKQIKQCVSNKTNETMCSELDRSYNM